MLSVRCQVLCLTFSGRFDSYRAHHSFQRFIFNQARTEALYRGIEKARVGAYGLEAHGTLTAHPHGVNPSVAVGGDPDGRPHPGRASATPSVITYKLTDMLQEHRRCPQSRQGL